MTNKLQWPDLYVHEWLNSVKRILKKKWDFITGNKLEKGMLQEATESYI